MICAAKGWPDFSSTGARNGRPIYTASATLTTANQCLDSHAARRSAAAVARLDPLIGKLLSQRAPHVGPRDGRAQYLMPIHLYDRDTIAISLEQRRISRDV